MITELAVERVEFTCGHCWYRWSTDYDVQHIQDDSGADWEYFSLNGIGVESPYTTAGAPPCPQCGRRWVGHLAARRPVPLPGQAEAPRQRVAARAEHRPDRHGAPLLGADAHQQPGKPERPVAQPTDAGRQRH